MLFSQYAVIDNVTHTLEKTPEFWWKFRPATSGDELAMARFYDTNGRTVVLATGEKRGLGPHWIEIMWRELALLFAETNIPKAEGKPVEDGGEAILPPLASVTQVEAVLQNLPQALVEELWVGLGKAVPGWGPRMPQPEGEAGETNSEN